MLTWSAPIAESNTVIDYDARCHCWLLQFSLPRRPGLVAESAHLPPLQRMRCRTIERACFV